LQRVLEPGLNELFLSLGISTWKPAVAVLLLPPVPWIVLVLWGAIWLYRGRAAGWLLLLPACATLWLGSTSAVGEMLTRTLLSPPPALGLTAMAQLKQAQARQPGSIAIVVLGAGQESLAPEYGMSNLTPRAMARLRYGVWLGRETGIPVGFSGGVGYGSSSSAPEAETAARIAAQEFGRPLKWQEIRSRDTRENANQTIGLLRPQGVRHIIVVTHGWHMPRALRAFEQAGQMSGGGLTITAAPMDLARPVEASWLRWMPSSQGHERVRDVLREWVGQLAGA
jgi:uncharacterized SAM-binding protein YcdF (DUF218 family)